MSISKLRQYLKISFFLLLFLYLPNISLAQGPLSTNVVDSIKNQGTEFMTGAGFTSSFEIGDAANIIIQGFLSLLGLIFIILIIVAGFNWMTAGGDENKVKKARSTIGRAVIGLIIIIAAYAITYFVFNALDKLSL